MELTLALATTRTRLLVYAALRHDAFLSKFSMARYWAWYLLGEEVTGNGADGPLVRALYVGNHTTRATRLKLARYFEFALPENVSTGIGKLSRSLNRKHDPHANTCILHYCTVHIRTVYAVQCMFMFTY